MPPHHHHRGSIEFAVAHELAAHGLAGCLVCGGEAITDVLVSEHGAGAVLDDIEFVELGKIERVVLGILQGGLTRGQAVPLDR